MKTRVDRAWLSVGAVTLLGWAAIAAEPWTLERALSQALTNNPDARLAEHRITAARASLQQADAGFWPRLQLLSSYGATDNPMMAFGNILNQRAYSDSLNFNDLPTVDNFNVRGVLTMPLYTGGKTRAGREAAKANTEAARQERQAVQNALGYEVVRAFLSLRKTSEFIRATQAAVASYETNVAMARRRLEAGALLRSDVLDLEVRLSQAREDLVRARNANSLGNRALRNLLGITSGELEVVDNVPEVTVPGKDDFSARPELAAAWQRERAAEEEVRGARSGYLPRLSAFGSLDYDYGWKYDNGGGSYAAGALLQWDLWDGRLTRAKIREAQAGVESAREQERKVMLALDFEVAQARLDLQAANERLKVSGQAVAQADESVRLTRSRFEQGNALTTQLIDAETALLSAQVRRAEAEADQRTAVAALRKALGLPQLDTQP